MKWIETITNNTSKLKRPFTLLLIAVAALEILVVNILHIGHGYFWFEELPAFGSGYGFISCFLIILVAKFILAPMVGKKEDYYD